VFKKYILCLVVGLLFGTAITGVIIKRRAISSYGEPESGYLALEDTNRELRAENQRLIENNNRLGEIQRRDSETIRRGQEIITELKEGIGNSTDTIDRIEKGAEAIERLISHLFEEDNES
jgi:hypothetical protein